MTIDGFDQLTDNITKIFDPNHAYLMIKYYITCLSLLILITQDKNPKFGTNLIYHSWLQRYRHEKPPSIEPELYEEIFNLQL